MDKQVVEDGRQGTTNSQKISNQVQKLDAMMEVFNIVSLECFSPLTRETLQLHRR